MVVNIPLIDNYRIRSFTYGWMLIQEISGREEVLGYYSTMKSAIESFLEFKIRGFDSTSIHSLLAAMKSFYTRLDTALQPLNLRVEPLKLSENPQFKENNPKNEKTEVIQKENEIAKP